MELENLLEEEVKSQIEGLKDIEMGTEQYKATVDGLTKLTDRVIKIRELDENADDKEDARKTEIALKLLQLEEEKKDRRTRNCIAVAGIVIPAALTVWGTVKSIKFEQEGTITTIMGRGFIQKLLPHK
jgi:hypothetical protein